MTMIYQLYMRLNDRLENRFLASSVHCIIRMGTVNIMSTRKVDESLI